MNFFKNMSISSWNVRGAANIIGRHHCKELVQKFQPILFVLLETHS